MDETVLFLVTRTGSVDDSTTVKVYRREEE
jgi:hypothetical protein